MGDPVALPEETYWGFGGSRLPFSSESVFQVLSESVGASQMTASAFSL